MKVLVLGWEYPPAVAGGLGAACHGLTTGLAELGHEVILAVPEGTPDERAGAERRDHPGIRRVWIGQGTAGSAPSELPLLTPYAFDPVGTTSARLDASRRLYGGDLAQAVGAYTRSAVEALSGVEVDVIHGHDWMTIPAALRLRLALRRPVCLHVHSTAFDRTGRTQDHPDVHSGGGARHSIAGVERAGARTADRIIAVSAYTRSVLVREYDADPERISVVHNAAPPARAGRDRNEPARPDEPPMVLFLGRLTRQKGAGFFLRAAARVHAERPEVRFIVAGSGEDRAALIEASAALGIAHRTFFPGSVDDATRDRLYRLADVFVLPSISEPFGLTPLEALRHGTPSIVSDHAGVREVLPSAPTVAPWDAAGLATEILDLVGSPERREAIVRAGLVEIESLTWAKSAADLTRAFELARGSAGSASRGHVSGGDERPESQERPV